MVIDATVDQSELSARPLSSRRRETIPLLAAPDPLHNINVVSDGEEKPVEPNTTKAGRAQNGRVVIRVLS
jgi:flagellar motor protein MotB